MATSTLDSSEQSPPVWRRKETWTQALHTWLAVPLGIVIMLYFVVGFERLVSLGSTPFPASVGCLLILWFALLFLEQVLPERWMKKVLAVVDVPTSFALRTMNLYFTPSFILLPLSPAVSGGEVGKMIAVFIVGYILQFAVTSWSSRLLQLGMRRIRKSEFVSDEDKAEADAAQKPQLPTTTSDAASLGSQRTQDDDLSEKEKQSSDHGRSNSPDTIDTADAEKMQSPNDSSKESKPLQRLRAMMHVNKDKFTPVAITQSMISGIKSLAINTWIYLVFFFCIGIPVWFATGYSMPIFLSLTVLVYICANAIPKKIKRIAHPVLVTALFTDLILWVIVLTRGQSIQDGLRAYKTNTSYLQYFRGAPNLPLPGAGDILSSLLDASIVALAMPMYQYRRELWYFLVAIIIPDIILAVPSLFIYPVLCYAIGISPERSLAFAPRSVTLALAQLCAQNLGADMDAISPIAVVSGISGPIFGPTILRLLRIPEADYVTWGVVLGANSSAIATAMLLDRDRRAAALSSLSMSLFGIIFVVLTVIPQVVDVVRGLVGL